MRGLASARLAVQFVADEARMPVDDLLAGSRTPFALLWRDTLIRLLKETTILSGPEIAGVVGLRSHASVYESLARSAEREDKGAQWVDFRARYLVWAESVDKR